MQIINDDDDIMKLEISNFKSQIQTHTHTQINITIFRETKIKIRKKNMIKHYLLSNIFFIIQYRETNRVATCLWR